DTLTLLTDLLTSQAPPGTSPAEIALAAQELIENLGLQPSQFFDQPFLTNRFFLEKRFIASMAIHGKKNTLLFRIFDINRKPLARTTSVLDLLGGQRISRKSQGFNVSWSWRFSPRTRVNFVALYRRRNFPEIFRRDEMKRYSFTVSRRFMENIVGFLRYRRRDRTSNIPFNDYTENRFMASVRMRF
ncbi:MAG: TIGR03016 family PEP-CTERM system-associated outer membrane protein, partial [Nitrosomonadaceae bacterium]